MHTPDPGWSEYHPAGHAAHNGPPPSPANPSLHLQSLLLPLPAWGDDVFCGHDTQSAIDSPPLPSRYVFSGHCTHAVAPDSANVPAKQAVQDEAP